jgi:methylmalonyl-CoA mutase
MPATTDDLPLAAEFPPASQDDWRKLVDGVLKGAPFEKLIARTSDGLTINPIYRRARDMTPIVGRADAAPWQIMQRIDHPDAAQANAQALHDLENGASGVTLVFADSSSARGFGLTPSADALARALEGIHLDADIGLELQFGGQSGDLAIELAGMLRRRKIDPARCDIRFGLDPIGAAAAQGACAQTRAETARTFTQAAIKLANLGFKNHLAAADGRIIHDAGGSEAQELAFVLACAVSCMRALEGAGVRLDEARAMIYARLAADADQFMTMAKFRALRLLWARVEQACGLAPKPLFIAAETAWRMLTQRDSDVNMLRATMAVFAAGLAGANSIAVLPHSLALGLPDAFARRIARNTQLILIEESNLARVADPAAGSGGIEALTRELCTAAWSQFQEIENAGGALLALEQNLIQAKVAAVRAARETNVARRKDVLTGASEFPNLHEKAPTVLPVKPIPPAHRGTPKISFDPLTPIRLAAPFEKLRDRSDAILRKTGARPKVLLANLGRPSDFTARAMFAKSFFEAGGIEAVDVDTALPSPRLRRGEAGGGQDVEESSPTPPLRVDPPHQGERSEDAAPAEAFEVLIDAFKESGAALVCLCSSDAVYADQAEAAARALQAAGARHIYLAGRPGEKEARFRAAGIGDFIFAGGNALATLEAAYDKMVAS